MIHVSLLTDVLTCIGSHPPSSTCGAVTTKKNRATIRVADNLLGRTPTFHQYAIAVTVMNADRTEYNLDMHCQRNLSKMNWS